MLLTPVSRKSSMIKIGSPRKEITSNKARISANIEIDGVSKSLFFETGQNNARYLCDETADGFLVGLLIPALQKHSDIYLDAPVSEKLLYNIRSKLIPALVKMNPKFQSVSIYPEETSTEDHNEFNGVATALSCGVDSFYTVFSNLDESVPKSLRLTHLVLFNAGNFGLDKKAADEEFSRQIEYILPVCKKLDLPLLTVNSNLMEFVRLHFGQVDTFCNVACALVLQKLIRIFYYSSAIHISDFRLDFSHSTCYALLNESILKTESFEMVSFGDMFSRFKKTWEIDKNPLCHKYLNICVKMGKERKQFNKINCSSCYKCIRTICSLDIMGSLSNYQTVFDLCAFYKNRARYWGHIRHQKWRTKSKLAADILSNAKQHGYLIPKLSYFWMLVIFIKNQVKKIHFKRSL